MFVRTKRYNKIQKLNFGEDQTKNMHGTHNTLFLKKLCFFASQWIQSPQEEISPTSRSRKQMDYEPQEWIGSANRNKDFFWFQCKFLKKILQVTMFQTY